MGITKFVILRYGDDPAMEIGEIAMAPDGSKAKCENFNHEWSMADPLVHVLWESSTAPFEQACKELIEHVSNSYVLTQDIVQQSGWLSPEGEFFPIDDYDGPRVAMLIDIIRYGIVRVIEDPEAPLVEKGWRLIYSNGMLGWAELPPTKEQLLTLKALCTEPEERSEKYRDNIIMAVMDMVEEFDMEPPVEDRIEKATECPTAS